MSDLRSLFPVSQFAAGGGDAGGGLGRIQVFNTNITSVSNGGQCCLWTVPTGASWAIIEVWGGGGAGPGACCCQQPNQSGGAGAYARKTITVAANDTFRICAAGSTCCSPSCCGTEGFPSYVQNESSANGSDTINLCARGGPTSCSGCFILTGCEGTNTGWTRNCKCGSFCGHDFGLPAISGSSRGMYCYSNTLQYIPSGPNIGSNIRASHSFCQCPAGSGCGMYSSGLSSFPGGGGPGANTTGGAFCWGYGGAGGLVTVTFR